MATSPPKPAPKAAPPAKFAAPAQPQAPAKAPPAAPPVAAPVPFVPPAMPKTAGLLTSHKPADHFATHDPVQMTTGVRQDPPADHQESVPDDPSMPMGLNQPLGWEPFANVPK